jgi:hypothetical protein
MKDSIDDYIKMNQAGQVLELCKKYYDKEVLMLNNGDVFATTMEESYNKQKAFVESVVNFDVKLVSSLINENVVELTFHYKMTGAGGQVNEFTGKHIQTWQNRKIIKEEYISISKHHYAIDCWSLLASECRSPINKHNVLLLFTLPHMPSGHALVFVGLVSNFQEKA